MNAKIEIAVAGAGFAGLETAFVLRQRLGDRAAITVLADRNDFLFKPNTIYIPFGADAASLLIPLRRPFSKRAIELVEGSVRDVDPDRRVVAVDGRELDYDYLVVATGSGMRPEDVPGLAEHAETIWTPAAMASLGRRLDELVAAAASNEHRDVLFLVPKGNKCAGPLYELVLMTDTWLRRKGVRDRVGIRWATFESTYIQAFGPKLHTVVTEEFEQRGIEGRVGAVASEVTPSVVRFDDGTETSYDLLVAFPPYVAAVDYTAFERDDRGFLRTELETRRVAGQERVFAPGDAGDFPVKQAFLAFLQADAVAATIAADITGTTPDVVFDPVSMCVMEEFDRATFAQVPLRLTGDPDHPVAVREGANGDYRVGVSPLWRLGKKMLGIYLPLRFRNGLPFHAGLPWQAMDLGLKGMSTVLARR